MDVPAYGDDPAPVDSLSGAGSLPGEKGNPVADLTAIESKVFTAHDFRLAKGQTLPVLELAYETYGTLSPGRDNGLLVVHGYTSSHHAAGRNPANGVRASRRVPAAPRRSSASEYFVDGIKKNSSY